MLHLTARRLRSLILCGFAAWGTLCCGGTRPARAGAYLLAQGYGQFIAGAGFTEGTRRFDRSGNAAPAPAYRKYVLSGYLEYGVAPSFTLVVAPTLARASGVADNTVTGSDASAIGGRVALATGPSQVVSVQVLVQPPLAPGDRTAQLAVGGARNLAVDARVMAAHAFALFGLPAFVDVALGPRVRADPFPTETRLDLAFGIRPIPRLLLLAQDFFSAAPAAGASIPSQSYDKVLASLVFDVTPRWSVQLGGQYTAFGRNTVREAGPFGAVWYRFRF